MSSWSAALEVISFLLIGAFGVYAALTVGISYDEDAEFRTYLTNIQAIEGLLNGNNAPYALLTQFHDRYYGIGFHIISYGLGSALNLLGINLLPFSPLGSRLIWGHLSSFLLFLGSGLLVRSCLLSLTKDRLIASLGMFTFLLWPYVFGHALMNVKDAPFMFAWLCCTYLALRIFQAPIEFPKNRPIHFILLGVLTGWLISIRVSGVLIFLEYFWFALFWFLRNRNSNIDISIARSLRLFGISLLMFAFSLYAFFPILWHNPLELINAISYMGSHPWQGNTLTAGEFLEPKTRLIFYITSWQLVKLPIFVIIGILAFTYLIARSWVKGKGGDQYSASTALYLSVLTILALLIVRRVALYNELRQVLFLAPLLMIIAIVGLRSFGRVVTITILAASTIFMAIDDVRLHPYQYTYVNEVARHTEIGKKFETDYYGLAVKETAQWLNYSNVDGKSQCLYVPSKHLWDFAIDPQKFPCVSGFPGDLSLIAKPFLFFVQARSVTNFRAPSWCHLLHVEERSLPFSTGSLRMGELYQCLPPKT